jgi:hypothetical protein
MKKLHILSFFHFYVVNNFYFLLWLIITMLFDLIFIIYHRSFIMQNLLLNSQLLNNFILNLNL